jgi:hypothetical protein
VSKRGVGARAFTRRARAAERRRTALRATKSRAGLASYATRLPAFHYGDILRRIPRAAWICALIACLNAVCWSIVTPAFQVPDEPDHYAYVKQLAETGRLPASGAEQTSAEEIAALVALRYYKVRQQPQNHTIASQLEESTLQQELKELPTAKGSPSAGVAASEPPLYYALEAIPYSLAGGGTVLDRLQLMRLFSALMAGITALFVFLFVRETLPAAPWAWSVAGIAVAVAPLLGFMSGAVNPDSLLFAVSAATFYCLARAFRRGLDTGAAVAIGAMTATGLLTKVNFIGLLPGVLLGLVVLSVRAARASGRSAYRLLALAVGVAASPAIVYVGVNLLSNDRAFGIASGAVATLHGSPFAELNYVWQFYLPRLPGTVDDFPGLLTTRQIWFDGYVGLYGWLDTTFPGWVYTAALIPAGAIAVLCGRALFQTRAVLRGRAAELAVYAVIAIGLMVLVAADSYHVFPANEADYGEARYLLPLLPLLGALLALAARGAGRRLGPAVGMLIVVLFLAHDIFSQVLVVSRYYG